VRVDFSVILGLLKPSGLKLNFYKYQGTGNDFILIDNREGLFHPDIKVISGMCDRRFGVGADGLILLNKRQGYDFHMQYFNSDGRESTMCGNGGRCIIAFADFLSLIDGKASFIGPDGEHTGTIISKNKNEYQVKLSLLDVENLQLRGNDYVINTGSPHLVRFVPEVSDFNVVEEGRTLRNHPDFHPDGINVNFIMAREGKLYVRTYERGVEDETLSCGTGVTASALAYAHLNNLEEGPVLINTRGGDLQLHFKKSASGFTDIFLEGPAVRVFGGNNE
jgi:diaminopimelate epimerase